MQRQICRVKAPKKSLKLSMSSFFQRLPDADPEKRRDNEQEYVEMNEIAGDVRNEVKVKWTWPELPGEVTVNDRRPLGIKVTCPFIALCR